MPLNPPFFSFFFQFEFEKNILCVLTFEREPCKRFGSTGIFETRIVWRDCGEGELFKGLTTLIFKLFYFTPFFLCE